MNLRTRLILSYIVIIVLCLGIVAVALLAWSQQLRERQALAQFTALLQNLWRWLWFRSYALKGFRKFKWFPLSEVIAYAIYTVQGLPFAGCSTGKSTVELVCLCVPNIKPCPVKKLLHSS